MKKISYLTLILIFLAGAIGCLGQKKSKVKTRMVGRVQTVFKPKIEVEDWKEFESEDLKLKVLFPKPPTVNKNEFVEGGIRQVKSTIVQSFINSDFYMIEVREYPAGTIPESTSAGENYGAWLKRFVLARVDVKKEKIVNFGKYKMVEFVYQQSSGEVTIHYTLVIGQKLYQMIVQLEVKKPNTLEQTIEKYKSKIEKFFLSFEISEEQFES
jgi:hypothetical protein